MTLARFENQPQWTVGLTPECNSIFTPLVHHSNDEIIRRIAVGDNIQP